MSLRLCTSKADQDKKSLLGEHLEEIDEALNDMKMSILQITQGIWMKHHAISNKHKRWEVYLRLVANMNYALYH